MPKATRVHSTPRRTASKIQNKKRARKSDLTANAAELKAIDDALTRMHIEYGDDADSRQDYLKLEARRRKLLQIFGSTPALSQSGIEAKALVANLAIDRAAVELNRSGPQHAMNAAKNAGFVIPDRPLLGYRWRSDAPAGRRACRQRRVEDL